MKKKSSINLKSNLKAKNCDLQKSKIIFEKPFRFERAFERFDFTNEWNNLGFGRIETNGSIFAISDFSLSVSDFDTILATFELSDGTKGVYAGVINEQLIFNREAGPVDGVEACLIEEFLNETEPVLIDIPFNYISGVTMRIDCDEAIGSGKMLADLYAKHKVPFSMAITTSNRFDQASKLVVSEVLRAGGSVVGHSHTHAPNWGGSREKAKWEAETSRERLKEILPTDYNFDFVVSPFHQNPKFAVEGLRDAKIKGFVGGIIKNDPEYLVSRASWAKDVHGIMTHSQQCMLHGDCYHDAGNSLDIYKQSFENHYKTNTFFGYLDHPFSNYKYGWNDEDERVNVHEEFLKYMKTFEGIWFANLVDAMSFLWVKVNTKVWIENDKLKWDVPAHTYKNLPDLCVLWKGEKHRVPING
jgi:hypothetical protein